MLGYLGNIQRLQGISEGSSKAAEDEGPLQLSSSLLQLEEYLWTIHKLITQHHGIPSWKGP